MENTDVHQKKAQILIVDDQAANLRILSAMLMKQGYEVRAVTSGSSALKSIELDPPDIILLDICMPGMDGYEVCQTLKDRESTQDIPIIFITALDEMVDKVRAFRLGAADYITKPFQMEEVLIRVENQLSIKRTREALQQSEARYRAIIEDQTELICRFQLDYTLTFVNQTFCRAFGRVPEDVIGQPVVDFFPDQQSVQQCAMQLHKLTTDDPFCINEHRIVNDQGDSRWIEWTTRAIFDMQGNISEFQAVGRDVTEQLQSEAERRKLQRAVEQSPTSIVITDIDGVIEYVNPKFTQLTGYTFAEARGSNPNILKAGDTAITAYQELWETIKSGRAWHGEFHNRRKNGELFWELASISPIFDNDGKITHFVAIKEDITERKAMEEELERARQQAEAATRTKSEFLANMSHEIRTPINAIIGMTNLLLDMPLNAEQQECTETIRLSSEALLALINGVLDFSKIEAGKLELEEHPFAMYDCIEESIDLLAPQAAAKNINLAYDLDQQVPSHFVGDMARIRQIMVNLLSNAVKFTSNGEVTVTVHANLQPLPDVLPNTAQLAIDVQDTGIGIPADKIDRLFESFSQLDASTTRRYGGTGLGLAISKRLAEMMNGTIWAESSPGEGSTFHVILSLSPFPGTLPPFLSSDQPVLQRRRVLVLSDHTTNRTILVRRCKVWGMQPFVAETVTQALQVLTHESYIDVALIDMHLPGSNSLSAAQQIAAHPASANMPLVLWTSLEMRSKALKWAEYKPVVVLAQPIRPSLLHEALLTIFQQRTLQSTITQEKPMFDRELGTRHPLRILLAEDNLINQKVTIRLLEKLGYRTDVVSNGLEAIRALEHQTYDVILMDVQMPEMDGVEATHCIRTRWPEEQQPCIVAMTAHALQGDREWLLEKGMDDYVSKPVRTEHLVAALSRVALQREATQPEA